MKKKPLNEGTMKRFEKSMSRQPSNENNCEICMTDNCVHFRFLEYEGASCRFFGANLDYNYIEKEYIKCVDCIMYYEVYPNTSYDHDGISLEKFKKLQEFYRTRDFGERPSVGIKHDDGKLRYDLIPSEALEALAEVITYGANKYEDNGWQNVDKERYVAAFFRHFVAWRKGETLDQESGLPHLKHMLTNIAFILYKEEKNND